MKISEQNSDNIKACLTWVLMCCGLSLIFCIVAKVLSQSEPTTNIYNFNIGNKEVNYGTIQRPSGY